MSNIFAKLSAVFLSSVVAVGTAYGAHQSLQDALPADFKDANSNASASATLLDELGCDIDCMNDFGELAGVLADYYRERKCRTDSVDQAEDTHSNDTQRGTGAAGAKPGNDRNALDLNPLFEGAAVLNRPAYTTPVVITGRGMPIAVIPGAPPAQDTVLYG